MRGCNDVDLKWWKQSEWELWPNSPVIVDTCDTGGSPIMLWIGVGLMVFPLNRLVDDDKDWIELGTGIDWDSEAEMEFEWVLMYNAPVVVSVIDDDVIPVIIENEVATEAFTVMFGGTVSAKRKLYLNNEMLQRVFYSHASWITLLFNSLLW